MITLYIKTHNKTQLKYFGKTTRNAFKYNGSGKYWLRHLKIHGTDISTEIVGQFEDENEASQFAVNFSISNNIIKSDEWANLRIENALDGKPFGERGHKFSEEERAVLSDISRQRWSDDTYKNRMKEIHKSRFTDDLRSRISENSKKMWEDPKRRQDHSAKMKGRPGNKSNLGKKFTTSHKDKISKALAGSEKSLIHKNRISWSRLIKYNPNLLLKSYEEFKSYCIKHFEDGQTFSWICKSLGLKPSSIAAVRKVILQNQRDTTER